MKFSLREWIAAGDPNYEEKKKAEKKAALDARIADFEEQLDHIGVHRDVRQSSQRDERTHEDAVLIDKLNAQIAELKKEKEDLDKPEEAAA
jgi:hypothetical protein